MTLLLMSFVWVESDLLGIPDWVKILTTVAAFLFDATVLLLLPASGTYVDRDGIRVRVLRTRRLAWAKIEDIRIEPMPALSKNSGVTPNVVVYAYLTTGRRVLLAHLNDLHQDSLFRVEREVEFLLTIRDEQCGADAR
ncbi:hypothetical protein ACWGB8_12760 [Kitasatospora sp. NPDC054939]